jgi:N-acetylneuraminate synthase
MNSSKPTYIIAEAGVNHNGSLDRALEMVKVAANCGADAVKFQTFQADQLVSRLAPKAAYQTRNTDTSESQLDMLKALELTEAMHRTLMESCREYHIDFLSTPFHQTAVDLLADRLGLSCLKIPSGEITNAPLLLKAARSGKSLIVSTGMSTLEDIEAALKVLAFGLLDHDAPISSSSFKEAYASDDGRRLLSEKVTLLHCTTEYPTPFEDVNLRAMETLRDRFELPVGLSDHSSGISVPIAAAALGAQVVEKHFTLDRNLPGPDHQASLAPQELEAMVRSIREIEKAMGSREKVPAPSEQKNMVIARKSLVSLRVIEQGERFTEENLGVKRPGNGISPMHYWDWLGQTANRCYEEDEMIRQ